MTSLPQQIAAIRAELRSVKPKSRRGIIIESRLVELVAKQLRVEIRRRKLVIVREDHEAGK